VPQELLQTSTLSKCGWGKDQARNWFLSDRIRFENDTTGWSIGIETQTPDLRGLDVVPSNMIAPRKILQIEQARIVASAESESTPESTAASLVL